MLLLLWSCGGQQQQDYDQVPTSTITGHLNAVIEIPAGTNKKLEYTGKGFEAEIREGKERSVDFLSYPFNYGFIPGTSQSKTSGGDGDPLDVAVLASSLPTGTVVEVIPIAVLYLEDGGEKDDKIIAVPADEADRIIQAWQMAQLRQKYPAILSIIQQWFMYYKGVGKMKFIGWGDEKEARHLVEVLEKK